MKRIITHRQTHKWEVTRCGVAAVRLPSCQPKFVFCSKIPNQVELSGTLFQSNTLIMSRSILTIPHHSCKYMHNCITIVLPLHWGIYLWLSYWNIHLNRENYMQGQSGWLSRGPSSLRRSRYLAFFVFWVQKLYLSTVIWRHHAFSVTYRTSSIVTTES